MYIVYKTAAGFFFYWILKKRCENKTIIKWMPRVKWLSYSFNERRSQPDPEEQNIQTKIFFTE